MNVAPTVLDAATTSVTVPLIVGSNGPDACPNPVIVTVPSEPTAGVVAVQVIEQVTDTKVNPAESWSVIETL